jgi:hypothetical protein
MGALSEAIKTVRALLPKKSISMEYLEIIDSASALSIAHTSDIARNMELAGKPMTKEEKVKTMESLFKVHIDNQIRLFEAKKA